MLRVLQSENVFFCFYFYCCSHISHFTADGLITTTINKFDYIHSVKHEASKSFFLVLIGEVNNFEKFFDVINAGITYRRFYLSFFLFPQICNTQHRFYQRNP